MYISILTCSTSFTVYFGVTQVMFFSVFFGWGISNTVDHRLLFLFGWEILVKLQYSVIFLLSIIPASPFLTEWGSVFFYPLNFANEALLHLYQSCWYHSSTSVCRYQLILDIKAPFCLVETYINFRFLLSTFWVNWCWQCIVFVSVATYVFLWQEEKIIETFWNPNIFLFHLRTHSEAPSNRFVLFILIISIKSFSC